MIDGCRALRVMGILRGNYHHRRIFNPTIIVRLGSRTDWPDFPWGGQTRGNLTVPSERLMIVPLWVRHRSWQRPG